VKKSAKKKAFIVMILFALFLGVGLFVVTQKGGGLFDLRNRASSPSGIATLTLQPIGVTRYIGDTFPVDLYFSTGGKNISSVALRLIYKDTGAVSVVDQNTTQAGTQITDLASTLDPSFATTVNQSQAQPSGDVYIDYATTTNLQNGYTNTSGQKLATIVFKALKAGTVSIQHDPQRSIVTEKITTSSGSGTLDVLQTVPQYDMTIVKDTAAPVASINGDFGTVPVTATSSSVTFSWTGVDKPDRAPGTIIPLTYSYQFDSQDWSAFSAAVTVTKTLANGAHTFRVRAKDPTGNISTPTSPDSVRTFTLNLAPVLNTCSPDAGQTGTLVTLTGYDFGATRGSSIVKFGTKTAASGDYVSWSDTKIVVKVPSGANGVITVVVNNLVSNGIGFSLGTMLNVVFNLEGITKDSGTKQVTVSLKRTETGTVQTFTNSNATWDATNKAYSATMGPLTAPFTTASTYIIAVKETARLQKVFKNITLTNNANNVVKETAVANTLPIGDFNNDNKLTADDVGLMLSQYTSISVPATGAVAPYDLNGDGVLDTGDIGLLLSKYTKLETDGDAF
jgi:uncharacterized protein (DUF697 family)